MKFYNRENELELLQEIVQLSQSASQMTVLTGRRRIGKTKLLLRATENMPCVYLFVSRKSESILCNQFAAEASQALNVPIGNYNPDLLQQLNKAKILLTFTSKRSFKKYSTAFISCLVSFSLFLISFSF